MLAFFAIIANATEASPTGSVITIDFSEELLEGETPVVTGPLSKGIYAVACIRDSGIGIPPSDLPHLFGPFFTTKGTPHKGLGLTTALIAVHSAGGEIDVVSQMQEGSVVKIFVPAREKSSIHEPELRGSGQSVLVINTTQDDWLDDLVPFISRFGYKPSGVRTRRDATRLLYAQNFDAVMLDAQRGGIEVSVFIEEIRRIRPTVPIIVLLGAGETSVYSRLVRDGASKVIVKTGDVKQIVKNLKDVFEGEN